MLDICELLSEGGLEECGVMVIVAPSQPASKTARPRLANAVRKGIERVSFFMAYVLKELNEWHLHPQY